MDYQKNYEAFRQHLRYKTMINLTPKMGGSP